MSPWYALTLFKHLQTLEANKNMPHILQVAIDRVETALEQRIPSVSNEPQRLHGALRYAVLGGGKRVRPALVYASGTSFGLNLESLDGIAACVEMIHAYSLIHDDLPAMDNDELRRGRPTCHIAFDEATAILAGDALQVLAFELLAIDESIKANPEQRLKLIAKLSHASGTLGMAGGQYFDLEAEDATIPTSLAELQNIHALKTGALIEASILMPAFLCDELTDIDLTHLETFAHEIGIAFQIQDDILDEVSDTQTLGKQAGADRALNKATYPAIVGIEEAYSLRDRHFQHAENALSQLAFDTKNLHELATFIVQRDA